LSSQEEIYVYDEPPVIQCHSFYWLSKTNAGIIEKKIEASVATGRFLNQLFYVPGRAAARPSMQIHASINVCRRRCSPDNTRYNRLLKVSGHWFRG
jgi:hypothetical protein